MGKLAEFAVKYGTDKSIQYHNYIPMYEDWLKERKVDSLLEIGFGGGASAKMWLDYFPNAKIHSLEYADEEFKNKWKNPDTNIPNLNMHFGSSTVDETWLNIPHEFDIIVDDGSHDPKDQIETILIGFSHLKSRGLYFIEDTHCGFKDKYKEKYNTQQLHYDWFFERIIQQQTPGVAVGGDFYQSIPYIEGIAKDILSYHFYKSVIILEKA